MQLATGHAQIERGLSLRGTHTAPPEGVVKILANRPTAI
jgi:hypothetical protein